MSERTIITTIEVTQILKDVPECFETDKEQIKKDTIVNVKAALGADDVVVTNVQDFVRERSNHD